MNKTMHEIINRYDYIPKLKQMRIVLSMPQQNFTQEEDIENTRSISLEYTKEVG